MRIYFQQRLLSVCVKIECTTVTRTTGSSLLYYVVLVPCTSQTRPSTTVPLSPYQSTVQKVQQRERGQMGVHGATVLLVPVSLERYVSTVQYKIRQYKLFDKQKYSYCTSTSKPNSRGKSFLPFPDPAFSFLSTRYHLVQVLVQPTGRM